MASPTKSRAETNATNLRDSEEGTALFEGVLTLLLFLPIWMFIIYIGTAGIGLVDAYQTARNALWQQQSQGGCGGNSIGYSGAVGSIGGGGTAQFSLQQQDATAGVNDYAAAAGFAGSVTRSAVAGCATYPDSFPESETPSFPNAVQDL